MKQKAKLRLAVLALAILVGALILRGRDSSDEGQTLQLGQAVVTLELADQPAERERGLSGHTSLEGNAGMLFIFPGEARPGFWMKDMRFPLDIIWLDANYQVVDLDSNVSPQSYPKLLYPSRPIRYVLEVEAGFARDNNIRIGNIATPSHLPH